MFYGLRSDADMEVLNSALASLRSIFPRVVGTDNMILLNRSLGFRRDRKFMQAVQRQSHDAQERSLFLRLHTLAWGAVHALNTTGDFVECGVYRGYSSAVLAEYLDFATLPRQFYLYDTFAGIPPEQDAEQHDDPIYHADGLYQSVVARFAAYPNIRVIRGAVPESFAEGVPD